MLVDLSQVLLEELEAELTRRHRALHQGRYAELYEEDVKPRQWCDECKHFDLARATCLRGLVVSLALPSGYWAAAMAQWGYHRKGQQRCSTYKENQ